MLDALKEIIPLLEGVKDGAIWLVAAYFGVVVLEIFAWTGVVCLLALIAKKLLGDLILGGRIKVNDWNLYQWDRRDGEGRIDANFSKTKIQDLLQEIAGPGGYVHDSDINAAIEKLRK